MIAPAAASPIPTVTCSPMGPGCDSIGATNGGATTNPNAQNATANDRLFPTIGDIEPPDQGMCAGGGFVMEAINIGEVRIFSSNLAPLTSDVSLDNLMGLTARNWSSGGDISCLFDAANGGHWFVTEFVSTTPESIGGVFAGCFAGVRDTCREGIAVSATSDPEGAYNVYFLDPNFVNSDPGKGFLLNDFTKLGNTRDAFLMFYDEFNLNGSTIPPCPAFGCLGFNGAQEFAFQKSALETGAAAAVVALGYENLGLVPTPDGNCNTAVFTCWMADIPAATPDATQFDNNFGGSGFMVGTLDFSATGNNRLAVFFWTGLSALNSAGCGKCSKIAFGIQVLTGLEPYFNNGIFDIVSTCISNLAGSCGMAAQKAGPIPLGDFCVKFHLATGTSMCPEGGIQTNGDFANEASFSQGHVWTAISTILNQRFAAGSCSPTSVACETHLGAAYFVVSTGTFDTTGVFSLTSQGYVSAVHEDLEVAAVAAGDTAAQGAVISFTLSGNGGPTGANGGGFFPSSAFGRFTATSGGLVGGTVFVSARGQSPQDGFSEYLLSHGHPVFAPRWGDYGAAIFVPGVGFYFASEYIQQPNCSDTQFLKDPTCGGTRDPFANFGTSVNLVP